MKLVMIMELRKVNFAISIQSNCQKSTMFPHLNIHQYTWTYAGGEKRKQINHERRHSSRADVQFFEQLIVTLIIIWWTEK